MQSILALVPAISGIFSFAAFIGALVYFSYARRVHADAQVAAKAKPEDVPGIVERRSRWVYVSPELLTRGDRLTVFLDQSKRSERKLYYVVTVLFLCFLVLAAVAVFSPRPSTGETPPSMGWAYAGDLDKNNPTNWSFSKVRVIKKSGAADRPFPVRTGDIIEPTAAIHMVIVDWRDHGTLNQLTAPFELEAEVRSVADYTGTDFTPGTFYLVKDVRAAHATGKDYVLWLLLQPADKDCCSSSVPSEDIGSSAPSSQSVVSETTSTEIASEPTPSESSTSSTLMVGPQLALLRKTLELQSAAANCPTDEETQTICISPMHAGQLRPDADAQLLESKGNVALPKVTVNTSNKACAQFRVCNGGFKGELTVTEEYY